jgi:pre-mRNA-splicing helicase BRR2
MPPKQDLSGYQYSAMSSLVLTAGESSPLDRVALRVYLHLLFADRSHLPRRDNEPDGTPETLVGRIDPKSMGSRAQRTTITAADKEKKKKRAAQDSEETLPRTRTKRGPTGYRDILAAAEELEGLVYKPRTSETREVYELFLSVVDGLLGDQPADVVRSAADLILGWLKDENLKDLDRLKEIKGLVGMDVVSYLVLWAIFMAAV